MLGWDKESAEVRVIVHGSFILQGQSRPWLVTQTSMPLNFLIIGEVLTGKNV